MMKATVKELEPTYQIIITATAKEMDEMKDLLFAYNKRIFDPLEAAFGTPGCKEG